MIEIPFCQCVAKYLLLVRNELHKAEIIRKEVEGTVDKIHQVCPVTCKSPCFNSKMTMLDHFLVKYYLGIKCAFSDADLKAYHENQFKKHYSVYVHIVNCYMARQEENKETWRRMRVTKEQPKASFAREQVIIKL